MASSVALFADLDVRDELRLELADGSVRGALLGLENEAVRALEASLEQRWGK